MKFILTQKNRVKVNKETYDILLKLSFYAMRLYNEGLYKVRQYFFSNNSYLNYSKNYHLCKESENYKMLLTDTGQQTLRLIERNFKSFFALLKMKQFGKYSEKVRAPKYKREKYGIISIQGRSARIRNGYVLIGFSKLFKETFKPIIPHLKFKLPKNITTNILQEVRIIPLFDGKEFDIEFVYYKEVQPKQNLNKKTYLSIDCGLNNFVTAFNSINGSSFIIDGRYIKSINQRYNKEKARLQSIKDLQHYVFTTKKIISLSRKREFRINDYLNRSIKYITDYCLKNSIGNIVIGNFEGIKNGINLGKKNNQNFVQIPYGKFKQKLNSKCEQLGIEYNYIEECYTSKCSFLDKEDVCKHENYLGSRIKRGLFKTSKNILVNADVNGSANILQKFLKSTNRLKELHFKRVVKGFVNNPVRVNFSTMINSLQSPCL
jgi:putative transposase